MQTWGFLSIRCWSEILFFLIECKFIFLRKDGMFSHLGFQSISMFGYSLYVNKILLLNPFFITENTGKDYKHYFHIPHNKKRFFLRTYSDLCKICSKRLQKCFLGEGAFFLKYIIHTGVWYFNLFNFFFRNIIFFICYISKLSAPDLLWITSKVSLI